MAPPENPSVLVLLVATDGARWLPDVLRGLRAQRYRPLRVVAVDNASTDGSAEILLKAFGQNRVVTLERRVGFGRALAAALKTAAERKLDADAFLVLHDDCMLAKDAVQAMVEQLGGDVGIVGAKLVDWESPELLQDIGQTTDRYGRVVARVERGELDQGQHDGVHDVLYASSAAMMIARETVEQVGLFDMRYVAMRDDLDLCWRARLAGWRTVVTTDAVARHVAAVAKDVRTSPVLHRTRYFGERNMIATLLKNYSLPRLLVALPVTIVASLINVLLFLASGRRRSALQVLEALQWNVVHLPSTLRSRVRVQRVRKQPDKVVSALMHHGATRLRSQLERAVEKVIGEVEEVSDEEFDRPPPTLLDRARAHPTAALMFFALIVGLLGARNAFFDGPLAGADFGAFPAGPSGFFRAYASGWRGTGAGGAGPASPGLVLLGMLSTLTFTSGWLAQRLLMLSLPLLGAFTMHRLTRALGLGPGPRRVSVVLFVVSPLMLDLFGSARLHDAFLLAAAPGLLLPLLRASGFAPDAGWRSAASGALGLAVVGSLAPWAFVFVVVASLALGLAAAGQKRALIAGIVGRAALMVGGALALTFPWSLELFKRGTPLWAGGTETGQRMVDLLALSASPHRTYPLAIGLVAVAAGLVGLLVAAEARRRLAGALTTLAGSCMVLAYLVARGVPAIAPRPSLVLAGAAVAVAVLAGIAASGVAAALSARAFGWRHVVVGVVGLGLAAMVFWGSGSIARGARPGWAAGDQLVPSFIAREAKTEGPFRVAWLSGSARRLSVALTGPEGATMTDYLARPSETGLDIVQLAARHIAGGSSESGARILATAGVRWVIVRPGSDASLVEQVARDPDLSFYQRFEGGPVFRNEVALPAAAAVRSPGWGQAAAGDPEDAVVAERAVSARALTQRSPTGFAGRVDGAQTVLLAEGFDDGWRARLGERELRPQRSFGWATRFVLPAGAEGTVRIRWDGQRWHRLGLLIQVLIVLAFAVWWSQRAARERGER